MKSGKSKSVAKKFSSEEKLFDKVVSILEQARSNVVRSVNTNMVTAYWLIGREIVQSLQGGEGRAEYGKRIIENLSARLIDKYGKGFSAQALWSFRQFYEVYAERGKILFPTGGELPDSANIFPAGGESGNLKLTCTTDTELTAAKKSCLSGSKSLKGFSPRLSWSHYRALMRVEKPDARKFYEEEAVACGWSKSQLERQIHSFYYERLLTSKDKRKMLDAERQNKTEPVAMDILKSPTVLEFLQLPESPSLHESNLEKAIIAKLQMFLLELGKGFAFVARQKRISTETKHFYIDLVFYNYMLKCFVLIDLKTGELTHQDIGQMDMYVRLFDDLEKRTGDNPTVGIILCSEKDETIVKYSVLRENKKLFASKYMLYLPTEEQLKRELARERRLIEEDIETRRTTEDE